MVIVYSIDDEIISYHQNNYHIIFIITYIISNQMMEIESFSCLFTSYTNLPQNKKYPN